MPDLPQPDHLSQNLPIAQPRAAARQSWLWWILTLGLGATLGAALSLVFSPLRSKLFLLSALATIAATAFVLHAWFKNAEQSALATWTMRIGASFLAAFFIAFIIRKAIIGALIVGGSILTLAVLLNKFGLGISQEHLDTIKSATDQASAAVQQAGDSLWATVKPHLPSSSAAATGLFCGARHNAQPGSAPIEPKAT